MDTERWQELQDLFAAARAQHGEARERLLVERSATHPELVAEVRSLLDAEAAGGIMDALSPRLASVAAVLREDVPERLGAYRITGEVGRGGMGVVYLAERADGQFRQRVAIKLIGSADRDDPQHQRFLAERQILAGLTHPNIARLVDGGLTDDGRPYLVMEYVDGVPITSYCDRHRLDVRARLRLFADVCAAVQHAHQNLVIHRDLKPSNILVSPDGRVHLLDFGIAKLLNPSLAGAHSPLTRGESLAMTPEYASPEQVRGDPLTTASDLYSLGVLLYELLAGSSPYRVTRGTPVEVATAVCEQEPERPSTRAAARPEAASLRGTTPERLARQLAGDLDGIVLLALRKEPAKRYASADMLRQDVERALAGQPVLAHAGSTRYRIGKFVRRHRIEAAATLVVLVSLVSGLSVSVGQGRRAERERARAEQALLESQGVTDFLLELFRTGDPGEAPTGELSALQLLERGARRADQLFDQPIVQARLLDAIGQMSFHLGHLDEAQRRLEQAVAIRRSTLGHSSLDLAGSLIHLARVHRSRNDVVTARALVREALDIRRRVLPRNHPAVAEAYFELGWLFGGREQERYYRQSLALLPDTGASVEQRVKVMQGLATNLRRQGRLDETVAMEREALGLAERTLGPEHPITGYAMIHLADHIRDIEQDPVTAERLYRRGLELMERVHGKNGNALVHGLNSLATLLASRGDAEAEQHLRRILDILRTARSPEHPSVADGMENLALELARQGRTMEAESLALRALEHSRRTLGTTHSTVIVSRLTALAQVYEAQGRHELSDRTWHGALDQLPAAGVAPAEMRRVYGRMLIERGAFAAAEEQLLASLQIMQNAYRGTDHPNVVESRRALMELYQRWGKPELVSRYRTPPGRFVPY